MDFTNLKAFMNRLTAWRIPGNSISVCIEGKEVFNYQSGYSDLENQVKMNGNVLFNIYSCSKVATVTAALQLYEKGFFLLDDPLYDFIPEYKEMYVNKENGIIEKAKNTITLRHLFTMTSGLSYNINTPAFKKARELTNGKMDTLTVIKCLSEDPLSFEAGEHWQYSLSHDVLAAVVEIVSGKKFRDYVKENIFLPLEMNDSYYHNEKIRDRMAEQYVFVNSEETDLVTLQSQKNKKKPGGYVKNVGKNVSSYDLGSEYDSGGAGITTTVEDYSKFCSALANGGIGQNGEKILSKGTVDLLRTNQLNEEQLKDLNWSQLKGYGYGLGVRTLIDKAKSGTIGNIGEFGWGGAAGANVLIDPDIK